MQYDRFGEVIEIEDEKINDISINEIGNFIENNRLRYIDIFKKNENKKIFLHMNWAAMFLSIYWMFYRKMYKAGVLFLLCLCIFSTLIFSLSLITLKDDIIAINKQEDKAMYNQNKYSYYINANFTEEQTKLNEMKNDLNNKLISFIVFPSIAFSLLFGLIADCLYRNHMLRKIRYSDGGVSKKAVFGALGLMIGYNFIMDIVQNTIINSLF